MRTTHWSKQPINKQFHALGAPSSWNLSHTSDTTRHNYSVSWSRFARVLDSWEADYIACRTHNACNVHMALKVSSAHFDQICYYWCSRGSRVDRIQRLHTPSVVWESSGTCRIKSHLRAYLTRVIGVAKYHSHQKGAISWLSAWEALLIFGS